MTAQQRSGRQASEVFGDYLLRHADALCVQLDGDNTVLALNERAQELVGQPLLGRAFESVALEEQRPALTRLLADASADWSALKVGLFPDAQGVPKDYEVCVRRLDGTTFVVAQPLLSDLEHLNRELLTLNDELIAARSEIEGQRDALDEQNTRLLELDRITEVERVRNNFLTTVSHELRTPLAGIYGAALTLARSDLDLTRAKREPLLEMLVEQAERLKRITETILLASTIDSDELANELSAVDPLQFAVEIAERLRERGDRDVVVREARAGEALGPLSTDRNKLAHVLTHLLENAIRFSPDGGPVEVLVSGTPASVRFRIEDHGLGIPVQEQERIFEKFYRVDVDMKTSVGGTGLGLYICRRLVEQLGGRIWVTSREGEGSMFFVEIPRSERAERDSRSYFARRSISSIR